MRFMATEKFPISIELSIQICTTMHIQDVTSRTIITFKINMIKNMLMNSGMKTILCYISTLSLSFIFRLFYRMKEIPGYFAYFAFLPRFGYLDFLADHMPMIRFEIFFYRKIWLNLVKKIPKIFFNHSWPYENKL